MLVAFQKKVHFFQAFSPGTKIGQQNNDLKLKKLYQIYRLHTFQNGIYY